MAIQLPPLPYATNALEPHISAQTLEFHYGKHHKAYVDTVNELIKDTPLDKKSLEEIILASVYSKRKTYNNAAQAWNHTFFWNCLKNSGNAPSSDLTKILAKNFGSFDKFKIEFTTKAKNLFGSGWVWLVKDERGNLSIRPLSNAGNPIAEHGETPLLTCDVWEHAYYLDYQNNRPQFLENFWRLVNWHFVETNLNRRQPRVPADQFVGAHL